MEAEKNTATDGGVIGTIAILNWNGKEFACRAIDAALRQTLADRLLVMVVDNGSGDGSAELFREQYGDRIAVVAIETNCGFTGAYNRAFPHCRGKYVFLLNNDAIVEPAWAEELIKAAESRPGVGMCTAKIYAGNSRAVFDNVGQLLFRDGLNRSRGNNEADRGQYDAPDETLFASGCASLYLLEAVRAVGGFDETFFAYGEDTDLGLKIRLLGLDCLYVPGAVADHLQSKTWGAYSLDKIFLIERNRIWIMWKFLPAWWILTSPFYSFLRLFAAYRAGRKRDGLAARITSRHSIPALAWTMAKAWLCVVPGIPRMLRLRWRLRSFRRLNGAQWKALLSRHQATVAEMAFDR